MSDERTARRDPDALLRRAGVRGDPDRDQHFLVDDRVLDRLVGYLPDGTDLDHLLEIGGGTGALTDRLLAVAGRVTVVERDPALAGFLREEFAERMAAEPGIPEYGRLSVTAGHYADVEVVEPVPPEAFDPAPAVESAAVRCAPRDPEYDLPDETLFMDLVKACFTQRRKTMRNAVRNTVHISGLADADAGADAVVAAAGEELMGKRAGDVTPAEFARLARLAADVGVGDA